MDWFRLVELVVYSAGTLICAYILVLLSRVQRELKRLRAEWAAEESAAATRRELAQRAARLR